jgi:hypothetical protein
MNRLEFTEEQQQAYDTFIKHRDHVGVVKTKQNAKAKWIRHAEVECSVDVTGINHPLFVPNTDYMAYIDAFDEWLMVEPHFREEERMRASRGDYGEEDSWDEVEEKVLDLVELIKENTRG